MEQANVGDLSSLSRSECLALLASAPVGRIAGSMNAMPFVFPVNYSMFEHDILIRSNPGTKLDAAIAGAVVAFEVDHFSEDGSTGWSVLVRGMATEITRPAELVKARAIPMHTYAFTEQPSRMIRIATGIMTGRRFDHNQ